MNEMVLQPSPCGTLQFSLVIGDILQAALMNINEQISM